MVKKKKKFNAKNIYNDGKKIKIKNNAKNIYNDGKKKTSLKRKKKKKK